MHKVLSLFTINFIIIHCVVQLTNTLKEMIKKLKKKLYMKSTERITNNTFDAFNYKKILF